MSYLAVLRPQDVRSASPPTAMSVLRGQHTLTFTSDPSVVYRFSYTLRQPQQVAMVTLVVSSATVVTLRILGDDGNVLYEVRSLLKAKNTTKYSKFAKETLFYL